MITVGMLTSMAEIVKGCQRGATVARVAENGDVHYGTLRSLSRDHQGNYAHGEDDPEKTRVRITWESGFEGFPMLVDVAEEYDRGEFVIDPSR